MTILVFFCVSSLIAVPQPVAFSEGWGDLYTCSVWECFDDFALPDRFFGVAVVTDVCRSVRAGDNIIVHDKALALMDVACTVPV